MSDDSLLHEWTERPFVAHDKRRWEVEHRLVLRAHNAGVDVEHDVRSSDDDSIPDDWTPVEAYEVRRGAIERVKLTDRPEVLEA